MKKLKSTARKLDTFLKWIYYLLIAITIFTVGIALVCIVIMMVDSSFAQGIMESFDLGNFNIDIKSGSLPSTSFSIAYFIVMMLFFLCADVVIFLLIKFFRNILKCLSNGTPFSEAVCKSLTKTGFLVIIYGVLSGVFSIVETALIYYGYNMPELFVGTNITKIMPVYNFDLGFVVVAAAIFLLVYIIKYGSQLQKEVDETL